MDYDYIKSHVNSCGEVHLVVEEHDSVVNDSDEDYIGIRTNENYEFVDSAEVIKVDEGDTTHHIPSESVVYMNCPGGFPD